jgi:hypothetical protein
MHKSKEPTQAVSIGRRNGQTRSSLCQTSDIVKRRYQHHPHKTVISIPMHLDILSSTLQECRQSQRLGRPQLSPCTRLEHAPIVKVVRMYSQALQEEGIDNGLDVRVCNIATESIVRQHASGHGADGMSVGADPYPVHRQRCLVLVCIQEAVQVLPALAMLCFCM